MIDFFLKTQGFKQHFFPWKSTKVSYLEGGVKNKEKHPFSIIVFPGYGDNVYSSSFLLQHLAKDFHLYALDFPGFSGFSEKPKEIEVMSFDHLLEVADLFVNQIVPDKKVLIGNSMGGWIALKLAHRTGSLIKHVIGINSAGYFKSFEDAEKIKRIFQIKSLTDQYNFLKTVFHVNPMTILPLTLLGHYQHIKKPEFIEILTTIQEHHALNEDLSKITTPVSLLWGTSDRLIPRELGEKMIELLPNGKFYPITNSGHMPQFESPLKVFKVLDPILFSIAKKM